MDRGVAHITARNSKYAGYSDTILRRQNVLFFGALFMPMVIEHGCYLQSVNEILTDCWQSEILPKRI